MTVLQENEIEVFGWDAMVFPWDYYDQLWDFYDELFSYIIKFTFKPISTIKDMNIISDVKDEKIIYKFN